MLSSSIVVNFKEIETAYLNHFCPIRKCHGGSRLAKNRCQIDYPAPASLTRSEDDMQNMDVVTQKRFSQIICRVASVVMSPIFAACQKFDARSGDSWLRYIDRSGFIHIDEIVSVDTMLCPSLIDELVDDDWKYNIHADFRAFFFYNYNYLKRRVKYDSSRHNILALTEQPTANVSPLDGFTFCGYDILDGYDSISVLTNCGEHPSIFSAADINRFGLINDLDRVTDIAEKIRGTNPDDDHCCDCRVWGLARYVNTT